MAVVKDQEPIADDLIKPFMVETAGVRGRVTRLGSVADEILTRHDYPEPVAGLLAEMLGAASLLSNMLKFEGVFSLQTKGDGPVSLMVVDITSEGELRGYAEFDEEAVAAMQAESRGMPLAVPRLLGHGYIAFTVDQGPHTERYQGIVELRGRDIAECVQHYFRQSEQLATAIKSVAGRANDHWRVGGIILQQMPPEEADAQGLNASARAEGWERAHALMATALDDEFLDPRLAPNELLFRLYHEDGVRVFPPRPLAIGCRCSRERVTRVLASLPRDDVSELRDEEGLVTVTCQFCNASYRYDDSDLAGVYES